MPRMAEKLAGTFNSRVNRPDSLEIHVRRPSTGRNQLFKTTPVEHRDRAQSFSSLGSNGNLVRRISLVENDEGELENLNERTSSTPDEKVQEEFLDIIQEANMDGVRHLKSANQCTKTMWLIIIIVFIVLALFQIYSQIQLYAKYPVATNIDAEYPSSIPFPTIAVCNNNQYRLTYITNARLLNRKPKNDRILPAVKENSSVFDRVLQNSWDMDAVRFLRNAAHWKSRMILGCTWPNGTQCKMSDFKAVWTMTGLCWAINTDPMNPVQVTGSGAGHGLKLLLNVESYERVEACTPHFRTKSFPGLKILIYNQTDIPESSLNGVNVPPGYSMDIPFKMQHRHKLPGSSCKPENEENIQASKEDFFSEKNIRTCAIREYITEIERICDCSLRRAFANPQADPRFPFCNVDEYFECVQRVIKKVRESGQAAQCLPPCESIDYTAWQDMNRLPQNIMPAVIDELDEEDEHDVEEDDIDDDEFVTSGKRGYSHGDQEVLFTCAENARIAEKDVGRIKREAHRAYEKQSRYQEDIHLRTKRLIQKLFIAKNRLTAAKWGWHIDDFVSVFDRLNNSCECFQQMNERHLEISRALSNPPPTGEERRTHQVHMLVDERSYKLNPEQFKTIGDLKAHYGDKVETVLNEIQAVLELSDSMWTLFNLKSYHTKPVTETTRMDRIFELMKQYDDGKLQRRAWAEKMESRQMRHFFEEEFYDIWYQPIYTDLNTLLVKTIGEIGQTHWPKIEGMLHNGTADKIGSVLFFGEISADNATKFKEFLTDVHECVVGDVNKTASRMLTDFRKMYKELQAAYNNIFKKELPQYLENFEFGSKFESDNFAMVNIYLHKMHLEHWRQDRTYTFWSLACDVGGALGLFLGASLLTIIELIYLCFHYGFCRESYQKVKDSDFVRKITNTKAAKRATSPNNKPKKPKHAIRSSFDPQDVSESIDRTPGSIKPGEAETPKKSSLWGNPLADIELGRGPRKAPIYDFSDDPLSPLLSPTPTMDDIDDYQVAPLHKKKFSMIPEADTPPDSGSHRSGNNSIKQGSVDHGYGSTLDSLKSHAQPSQERERENGENKTPPRRVTLSVSPPGNNGNHEQGGESPPRQQRALDSGPPIYATPAPRPSPPTEIPVLFQPEQQPPSVQTPPIHSPPEDYWDQGERRFKTPEERKSKSVSPSFSMTSSEESQLRFHSYSPEPRSTTSPLVRTGSQQRKPDAVSPSSDYPGHEFLNSPIQPWESQPFVGESSVESSEPGRDEGKGDSDQTGQDTASTTDIDTETDQTEATDSEHATRPTLFAKKKDTVV